MDGADTHRLIREGYFSAAYPSAEEGFRHGAWMVELCDRNSGREIAKIVEKGSLQSTNYDYKTNG